MAIVTNPDGTTVQIDDSTIKPIQKTGAIRSLGDTLLRFGRGGVNATKYGADFFGAGSKVSNALQATSDFIGSGLSDEAKFDQQVAAQRTKNAAGKGAMAEIGATLRNFYDNPIDTVAEGAGSIIPTAAAMIASRGRINPAAAGIGLGAVQGAGAVKGSIYDAVKQDATAKGMTEQQADKLATDAQAYSGQNRDQIALGAGLGAVAGATGAEATSLLTGNAREAAKNRLRETLKGFATEGGTEALQGGQEQYAANVAQNRLGANIDPFQGVAGQATAEGIAGGVVGGAFSLADTFQAKEQLKSTILQQGNGGVISQAAGTAIDTGAVNPELWLPSEVGPMQPKLAVDTGAAQPVMGLPNYVGEPLVTFPDGTTMTRAEAQAKYTADELAQFEQRVGMNQKPAVAGLLQTREANPMIVFADGSTGTKQQFDEYLAGLPNEAERMKARARFLGYAPQQADAQQEQAAPVRGLLQSRDQDPMIVYPDGSTGKRSEFDGYINSLPEQQRVTEMARLLGYGPQQGGENATQQPVAEVAAQSGQEELANAQTGAGNELSATGSGDGLGADAATLAPSMRGDIPSGTQPRAGTDAGNATAGTDVASAQPGDVIELNGVQWRKMDNGGFEQVMGEQSPPVVNDSLTTEQPTTEQSSAVDAPNNDITANDAATSVFNELPEPTEAQKQAGNYKVGRMKVGGLDISVENPDQSMRTGKDPDGTPWETVTNGHYGYIKGVKARSPDKEHVDVNVKPGTAQDFAGDVFIVNQNDPRSGKFDEPKVYMGYADEAEAEAAYRSNYAPDWQGFGGITRMPMADFKAMLDDEKAFLKPVTASVQSTKNDTLQVKDTSTMQRQFVQNVELESIADLRGNPTGWKRQTADNKVTLFSQDGKKFIEFENPNKASGTEWVKTQAKATSFAIDNPYSEGPLPQGELIAKPIFNNQGAQDGRQVQGQETAQEVTGVRSVVEAIVKRRAAANQIGKGRAFNNYLDKAKRMMAGETLPKNTFKLAQAAFQDDKVLADQFKQLDALLNKQPDMVDALAQAEKTAPNQPNELPAQTETKAESKKVETDNKQQTANPTEPPIADTEQPAAQQDEVAKEADQQAPEPTQEAAAVEEVAQTETTPNNKPTSKIEDFGEKIGGAKKDLWTGFKEKMQQSMGEDIASVPLAKSWPEPDYQGMIDAGADSLMVAHLRALRDSVPTKPRSSWKVKGWAQKVKALRDIAYEITNQNGNQSEEFKRLRAELNDFAKYSTNLNDILRTSNYVAGISDLADLYWRLGHDKSLKGIRVSVGTYSVYADVEYKPAKTIWSVEKDSAATSYSNWPKSLAIGFTKEEAISNFVKAFKTLDVATPAAKQVSFEIYSYKVKPGKFIIGKKVGKSYIDLKEFDSVKEAREYKANNQAELEAMLAKAKEIPNERNEDNNPRVGADHRKGADVTPQAFADTFGFRGVEFGNYVENDKRQQDLNEAYDALMDMAGVLNIPPKAISLNGELGIAFGARGSGGKRSAKAHYERDFIVINLTKNKGAGSLGHEWWHALDNYFSRMRGKASDFTTETTDVAMAASDLEVPFTGNVRKEMIQAFGNVVKAIKSSSLSERSKQLDKTRTKDYWSTMLEMTARSFESYLISKLQDQGASNDYLANIVSPEAWGMESNYPYPTAGEIAAIRAAYDNFFNVVETKESDDGNVAMFSRSQRSDLAPQSDLDALAALFTELETDKPLRKLIANRKVDKHPMADEIKRVDRDFYDIIGQLEDEGRLKINCKD